MIYITGTIDRKDGKRMTRKRADAVFDAFLGWLEDTQGCLFVGSFNPAYQDGDYCEITAMTSTRTVTAKEAGWHFPKMETKTKKRKTPKRKTKR